VTYFSHYFEVYCFGEEELEWGTESKEVAVQEEREKKSFPVVYFKPEDIPESPAEPDAADLVVNHAPVKCIPFEEFYNQNPAAKSALATLAALTAAAAPQQQQQPTPQLHLPSQSASQSAYNPQPTGVPAMYLPQHFTPQSVFQPQQTWVPQHQQQYVPQNNYAYQSQQQQQQPSYGNQQQYGGSSYNGGGNHQRNYNSNKKNQPCQFFMKGHCRMGDSCHYSHSF
jgi:hypothetical protein